MTPMAFGLPLLREWFCLFAFFAIAAGIVAIVLLVQQSRPTGTPPPPVSAFPVLPIGPGIYVIRGVIRATKMDTTWKVQADSEANARIKADLEGIIVASVAYEGPNA